MVETRQIREEDYQGIVRVADALPDWFDSDARERSIPIDLKHHDGFIAVADGKIVGFITLFVAEGRLHISWLGVSPDYHNQGIGSELLKRAEAFGKQRSLTELATYTLGDGVDYKPYEATRQFYFRRGFTIYQRNKTDNPGCPEEIKIKKLID
jgi:GNAT superfamily N-acetyltransferase